MDIDRFISSIRRIIRSEFPDYKYAGVYEYAIQSAESMKIDADPTDTTIGLPSIKNIELKPSIIGEEVTPTVGKTCLVMFVNRQPSRPVVISCEGDATLIRIGGPVALPAARVGDTVGGFLAITSGSLKTRIG